MDLIKCLQINQSNIQTEKIKILFFYSIVVGKRFVLNKKFTKTFYVQNKI